MAKKKLKGYKVYKVKQKLARPGRAGLQHFRLFGMIIKGGIKKV